MHFPVVLIQGPSQIVGQFEHVTVFVTVEYVPSDYEKELYDLDTEGFRKFAKEGDDKDIPQMEVGSHVWDSISSDNSIITFTFALKFDFSALSGLINTNCVSSKQLVFEQVVMRSEVN